MNDLILPVTYYSQRDSGTKHAYRMCFSSCCAMLVNFIKPGKLQGFNGDDQYLQTVFKYGDTVNSAAQIQALRDYGIKANFRTNLNWSDIDSQLAKKIPIPIGILHHGPASAPTGGGHWILIIGKTGDGAKYYVNDPYGDLDLVNGGYPGSTNGARLLYSKANLDKRWRVNGTPGWGVIA
jgi:uncharacterized protein YvpB